MANIESFDRALRIMLGATLLIVPLQGLVADVFAGLGNGRFTLAAVGVVLLVTATFRFCPTYALLGLRSCARESK